MKKIFPLVLAMVAMAATLQAQTDPVKQQVKDEKNVKKEAHKAIKKDRKELRKLESGDVSTLAKDAFAVDFGDVPGVTWKRSSVYDEASFTKDGAMMTAYYDYDSKLVGTVTEKTFDDLPAKAKAYINTKYAGYDKDKVIYYADNGNNDTDMLLYGIQFDDADNYFVEVSKNGKASILQVTPDGDVTYFTKM